MPDMYQSSEGLQQSLDDALVKIKQGTAWFKGGRKIILIVAVLLVIHPLDLLVHGAAGRNRSCAAVRKSNAHGGSGSAFQIAFGC
jgi:hypothetical protein